MPVTLVKPRSSSDMHMGLLIMHALTRAGVSYRVDEDEAGSRSLLTTAHAGAPLRITAHDCNGVTDYDVYRGAFMGFTAVRTDAPDAPPVYDGRDDHRRPGADADACALEVAVRLGLCHFCGWCEDTGTITLYDPSTDGQTGSRRCDNPPCVARAERWAAQAAAQEAAREQTAREHARTCPGGACCPPEPPF